jgi:hypothetical protein
MMPELELAPVIETKFNRLPWCHRASPSTTRHESVKSTDADKLMLNCQNVNPYFIFGPEALIKGLRRTRLGSPSLPAPILNNFHDQSTAEPLDALCRRITGWRRVAPRI